ncbi:MAG: bifunctional (p)ppGpp synthetase/guanosine-3',5'-bis(diphosphate) 3'-pyrophosphohydrolase [Thiotrichaceae bacterium]|nr:bifunctional (p)ppGpp synthetase/guanosine-3',5'-bis(diphosphate) 3'-pyrophosphohydrolase [Thiotrichaceae bacterium]
MEKQVYNIEQLRTHFSAEKIQIIEKALLLVAEHVAIETSHSKGIEVAIILSRFNVDVDTVIAAILSAPAISLLGLDIKVPELFGESVDLLVKDVNSLNQLQVYSTDMAKQPSQAETLRRMLLSMINDVRAVLIKLAYRIYRLRNLANEGHGLRCFIAQETLDIYAPIANRLGVSQLKWELEDLAFRYLQPQNYLKIVKSLDVKRTHREQIINSFKHSLIPLLEKEKISVDIAGRPKHIYSIWKKMQRKGMEIGELYDLLAVRVLVNELSSCYAVLGLIHGEWQYIPKEFDDYISNPKANGYQSLHTVIIDHDGHRIEVQIRTHEMHEFAENGVAAHWRYKEGSKQNAATEKNISSLRQLLAEKESDEELVDSFKTELFYDRVYVLSPEGKIVDLIKGATPLDFAYAIHTEVGHRCRGAKVNGRIVPLTYVLQSSEQVEILTTKQGEPNPNWIDVHLGYLKSPRAINKVRSWFKHQDDEKNIASGKMQLEKEIKQSGMTGVNLINITKYFNKTGIDQLFLAIGRGEISLHQLTGIIKKPDVDRRKPKNP